MKVEIYLNDSWLRIDEKMEARINLESRCDEVFGIGSFKAWLDIPYNIPPYTPLIINDNDYYLCTSICSKYLTRENAYVHDFKLIEASAVLSCYILGSKTFSVSGNYKKDSDKISILAKLMNQKYGIIIHYNLEEIRNLLIKEQDFSFGPGTTIYDALLEIAKTYNCIPKVNSIGFAGNEKKLVIQFYFHKLNNNSTPHILKTNYITNVVYSQNMDDYCKFLETEATNVIDRNDITSFKGLTVRSDDIETTASNAKILLPTRIEKVEKFYVNGEAKLEGTIASKYKDLDQNNLHDFLVDKNIYLGKNTYHARFIDWRNAFSTNNGTEFPFDKIYEEHFKKNFSDKEEFYNQSFFYNSLVDYNNGYFHLHPTIVADNIAGAVKYFIMESGKIDITTSIISKDQYDILELKDQPKFAYYTKYGNTIDGMYEYYKEDIWNGLLGKGVNPFLTYAHESGNFSYKDEEIEFNVDSIISPVIKDVPDPREYTFDVDVITTTNPFVSSTKSKIPLNQTNFFTSARSYEKSSNYIDFDKLNNSIQKNNDMLGMPELSIEYQMSNDDIFNPSDKILYDGKEWYIASIITYYEPSRKYCILNLVSDFNKIADAIGVETQYQSTKNPLDNIIDRHIFFELNYDKDLPNEIWLKFKFYYDVGQSNDLFKRATIMRNKNITYLYVETLDQYAFDKKITDYFDSEAKVPRNRYACYDIGYVDENNETEFCQIDIVELPELNRIESYQLPLYEGNYNLIASIPKQKLYKDSRERLIFTIKINNAIIR